MTVTALTAVRLGYGQWQEDKENPPEQSETEQAEDSLLEDIRNDSKLHLAVFVVIRIIGHDETDRRQASGVIC